MMVTFPRDSDLAIVPYNPTTPPDPKLRTLIRRRAMRDVVEARRKRGDHTCHWNRRQYSVFLTPPPHTPVVTADDHSLLLSLAPLTGLRLGLAVCAPGASGVAARLGSTKVFSFIPSRYGRVSALTHATDCVVAKRRAMVLENDDEREQEVLGRYAKALRALQVALDDEAERSRAETLCATLLLGIFELLLSQEPWRWLLRDAVLRDESLAGHVDLVLPLWEHLVGGPSHFKRTTDMICSDLMPHRDGVDDLIDCLETARDQLLEWLVLAQQRIGLWNEDVGGPAWRDVAVFPPDDASGGDDDGTSLAFRGTYATCRMLKARLLVALAPGRFHHLETEAQELAARVMSLEERNRGRGSLVASLFMSQGAWIAKSIVESRDVWSGIHCSGEGMVERWKFEAWASNVSL
ncbi:hypothetical protein OQA88_12519 [Cercophora sp. LCS_1]